MNQDIIFDTDRTILRETPGGRLERISLSSLLAIAGSMRRSRPKIPAIVAPITKAASFVRGRVTRAQDGRIEIPVPRRTARKMRSHA